MARLIVVSFSDKPERARLVRKEGSKTSGASVIQSQSEREFLCKLALEIPVAAVGHPPCFTSPRPTLDGRLIRTSALPR